MTKFNLKVFIVCILIVFIVAGVGSIFTSSGTNSEWYKTIRPSITPPSFIFPIVWSILFFLIAISLYITWISSKKPKNQIIIAFGINFILNILWSFFYFYLHNPVASFIDIIFLEISIVTLIFITYKINRKASYLLIPYFMWVTFASVLNFLSIL